MSEFDGLEVVADSGDSFAISDSKRLGGGIAGDVFQVSDHYAAKLYYDYAKSDHLIEKVRLLCARAHHLHPTIVAPRALLYPGGDTSRREVIGFLMTYIPDACPITRHCWSPLVPDIPAFDRFTANLLHDLCDGIKTLHQNRVYLADIKPENILVAENRAFIVDFDSCSFLPEYPGENFTLQFVDPLLREEPLSQGPYDFSAASDWWALAVVAFELLLGISPWAGNDPQRRTGPNIQALRSFHYSAVYLNSGVHYPVANARPAQWVQQYSALYQYFQQIFSPDPDARIPISAALENTPGLGRIAPPQRTVVLPTTNSRSSGDVVHDIGSGFEVIVSRTENGEAVRRQRQLDERRWQRELVDGQRQKEFAQMLSFLMSDSG